MSTAIGLLEYDSELMDVDDDVDSGFCVPQVQDIRIDTYFINDDHAQIKTRFTKAELHRLLEIFELDETIRVNQNCNPLAPPPFKYYEYNREELLIYVLMKMVSKRTHMDCATSRDFGGSASRWERGYHWLVEYLDVKFYDWIGPYAVGMWAPLFPVFRDQIYKYLLKEHLRRRHDGTFEYVRWDDPPPREQFNICDITDVKIYETCSPGSGPAHAGPGAPRRQDAYATQAAFWDPHHKKHAVKILTKYGPYGMTLGVYGPTAAGGRGGNDRNLFVWSGWDEYMMLLSLLHHGEIYSSYADKIFNGLWYSLRTQHRALIALGILLTARQENVNDVMKSFRVAIEHSYEWPSTLFPELDVKSKLGSHPEFVYAEIRVMHFLANLVTCLRRGTTCTGTNYLAFHLRHLMSISIEHHRHICLNHVSRYPCIL